ncbi:hypothetical protein BZG36_02364 [Bifiguratus adelaidae]|uniref:FAR1 domain-containing protein n=1 Tax=Bifiguratus adelaidae TaxID=1938954 RepID=A0A261Y150_9FUNG|nr:hypothetical protein BZG36_02364 [Bifiguratus adelaidae]
MGPFYDQLLGMTFPTAQTATQYCRNLCREFGFTVKQETSSNKNVYLYCSREGLPDSAKYNRQAKRKRSSNRCDCKWRIVLFENDQGLWEFRKSNNSLASEHNHELQAPESIPRPWPPAVVQRIAFYASKSLGTTEIRQIIQSEFPNITWDERRFYNRLSDERKKLKNRDTEGRVCQVMFTAARIASISSEHNAFQRAMSRLESLLAELCETQGIDTDAVPYPTLTNTITQHSSPTREGDSEATKSQKDKRGAYSVTSPSPSNTLLDSEGRPMADIRREISTQYISAAEMALTYPSTSILIRTNTSQKGRPSGSTTRSDSAVSAVSRHAHQHQHQQHQEEEQQQQQQQTSQPSQKRSLSSMHMFPGAQSFPAMISSMSTPTSATGGGNPQSQFYAPNVLPNALVGYPDPVQQDFTGYGSITQNPYGHNHWVLPPNMPTQRLPYFPEAPGPSDTQSAQPGHAPQLSPQQAPPTPNRRSRTSQGSMSSQSSHPPPQCPQHHPHPPPSPSQQAHHMPVLPEYSNSSARHHPAPPPPQHPLGPYNPNDVHATATQLTAGQLDPQRGTHGNTGMMAYYRQFGQPEDDAGIEPDTEGGH